MKNLKAKLVLKLIGPIYVGAILIALVAKFLAKQNQASDFFFMAGLILVCLAVSDILLHANLLAGWFRKQKKGETDEEYQKRKIDIYQVGSLKNKPIHFAKFTCNSLVLGLGLIALAIILTL